jgi:hypothetical protein
MIKHTWDRTIRGHRATWTCSACAVVVECAATNMPSTQTAGRVLNGAKMRTHETVPRCSGAPRGYVRKKRGNPLQGEARALLKLCEESLGVGWVAAYLGRTTSELTDAQDLALVQLAAALRVHLVDALEEVAIVGRRLREMQRARVAELAEGRGAM